MAHYRSINQSVYGLTLFAVVLQRQVAPQLGAGFTKGVHNISDLADPTALTVSWNTEGKHGMLIISNQYPTHTCIYFHAADTQGILPYRSIEAEWKYLGELFNL